MRNLYDKLKYIRSCNHHRTSEYIEAIFEGFIELHGDRCRGDDSAIICGIGWINDIPVSIIATEKGKNTQEMIKRNFGCPSPEGYRKAKRIMEQAQKFQRPVICFIDTIGANCSIEAEENGQAYAISECLKTMSSLDVPVISIITGEAESGGALALAVSNEVWMMEHAVYSVITPESCANILWGTQKMSVVAAEYLRMGADEALGDGIIDKIIFDNRDFGFVCNEVKKLLYNWLQYIRQYSGKQLLEQKYLRFRQIGKKEYDNMN